MPFDTILFDLDGTLLPLDMEHFIKIYFTEMGMAFHDMIEPKQLVSHIWSATDYMVKNIEHRTNEEVFMEKFAQLISGDLAVYQKRFDAFYDKGFLKTREAVTTQPAISIAITILKEKGYQLVIATNPLFPEKAIFHRINWAGCNPADFSYITSYERNHYCKPQIHFYQELLTEIRKQPEQCLMVGNDVQEDLIASQLGISTFLITDCLIHRTQDPIQSTYQGTYQDFNSFVQSLPSLI
jgi:FMN phosphatase YigB (HAD superfamily)